MWRGRLESRLGPQISNSTHDVVTKRANIELMFIDPHWNRLQFAQDYKFSVPVLNVTMIMQASHRDKIESPRDSLLNTPNAGS